MSTLRVSKLEGLSTSDGGITFSELGVEAPNVNLNVINRGSPSSSSTPVELRSFDQVHYYETTGSSVWLKTSLLQNSIYEFTYTSSGGSQNIDFVLQPNGSTYSNEFRSFYYLSGGGANLQRGDQTLSSIYFDHLGGGTGSNPMGTLRIHTGPLHKKFLYRGSDDGANLAIGTGFWTNDSRTWSQLGLLTFNGDNKRVWVRRIS